MPVLPEKREAGGDIAEGDPKGAQACAAIQPAGRNREGLLLKDRIIVLGGCNENQQETIMQKR